MEIPSGLYSSLSLLPTIPAPELPRPWTLSGEESGWSELGGGPTGSGQGVLDQEVSVNPSLGISKNMAKKF